MFPRTPKRTGRSAGSTARSARPTGRTTLKTASQKSSSAYAAGPRAKRQKRSGATAWAASSSQNTISSSRTSARKDKAGFPHTFCLPPRLMTYDNPEDPPEKSGPVTGPVVPLLPWPLKNRGNKSQKRGNSPGTIRSFPAGINEAIYSNVTAGDRAHKRVAGRGRTGTPCSAPLSEVCFRRVPTGIPGRQVSDNPGRTARKKPQRQQYFYGRHSPTVEWIRGLAWIMFRARIPGIIRQKAGIIRTFHPFLRRKKSGNK